MGAFGTWRPRSALRATHSSTKHRSGSGSSSCDPWVRVSVLPSLQPMRAPPRRAQLPRLTLPLLSHLGPEADTRSLDGPPSSGL
eukprot:8224211-Alexandrium_andersonii.AAC.1